ncbi:MAG: hypothetical protein A3B17_02185 [Candidatus Yanofskybacteria bacterium RIFCSPLOWO2_01_FULL_45_72]|nr:MAG: hypothetical protein A3B17_02185 [Candidatus Yanofskybacteria bacterium RIFCSPLOWO2_01_FULL_45_72]
MKPLSELVTIVNQLKAEGKRIVLGHGVFDLMHIGHMYYLEQAADLGDVLIVSIVDDKFVRKGSDRPCFAETIRRRSIASLGFVDFVAPCHEIGPYEIIRTLKPDVYVRAEKVAPLLDDPESGLSKDKEILDSVGGEMIFVQQMPLVNSTNLLNRYFPTNSPEVMNFLESFKMRHEYQNVVGKIKELSGLKVLVVGETIIDEYCHAVPLVGKPSKAPIVAVELKEKEIFAGGVLACANHVAGLCNRVDALTYIGKNDNREEFLRSKLRSNINPIFFHCSDRPTITKTRFVEPAYFTKMFEVYEFDRRFLPSELENEIAAYLMKHISEYDLVVVTDYGHGFFSRGLISILTEQAKFLAVNAQTNSGNMGFNYITKYQKAGYVCIDEIEARLATHDNTSPIEYVIRDVNNKISAKNIIVTMGHRGSIFLDGKEVKMMPSFTAKVVDSVGAGDAFLAFSSVCAAGNLPIELTALVGNITGAIAVSILGNKFAVDPEIFFRHLKHLLD